MSKITALRTVRIAERPNLVRVEKPALRQRADALLRVSGQPRR